MPESPIHMISRTSVVNVICFLITSRGHPVRFKVSLCVLMNKGNEATRRGMFYGVILGFESVGEIIRSPPRLMHD